MLKQAGHSHFHQKRPIILTHFAYQILFEVRNSVLSRSLKASDLTDNYNACWPDGELGE